MKPSFNNDENQSGDAAITALPVKFRDNYLLFQLAFLSHNFSEEFHNFLRSQGVSPSKWRILVNIYERPSIRVSQLAQHTLFEQSRVTKLSDQLVKDGIILKTIGKSDRRQVNLNLTEKGVELITPLIEEAKRHECRVLEQLDGDDAKKLKQILSKLTKPILSEI